MQAWEKKALAIIALTLCAEEQENIIHCMTPKPVWETLEKKYERKCYYHHRFARACPILRRQFGKADFDELTARPLG